jgi:hypothetical protein
LNHKIESLNPKAIRARLRASEPFELDSEPKLCWTYQYSGRIIKDKEDKDKEDKDKDDKEDKDKDKEDKKIKIRR